MKIFALFTVFLSLVFWGFNSESSEENYGSSIDYTGSLIAIQDSVLLSSFNEGMQLVLDQSGSATINTNFIIIDVPQVASISFQDIGQSTVSISANEINAACSDLGMQTIEVVINSTIGVVVREEVTFEVVEATFFTAANHIAVLESSASVTVIPSDFTLGDPITSCGGPPDITILNQSTFTCDDLTSTGGMLVFDGIDDHVFVEETNALDIAGSFTLEAWIKSTKSTGIQRIIAKPDGGRQNYSLNLQDGEPSVIFNGSTGSAVARGSEIVSDGLWHHIAGVFNDDRNRLILYVDGEQVASTATTLRPREGNEGLFIGNFSNSFNQQFEGSLDEIKIWNFARFSVEISDDFVLPVPQNETGLIAFYNFNELPGTRTAFDQSPNQVDGILTNMDVSNDRQNRYLGFQNILLSTMDASAADTVLLILQDTIQDNCFGKTEIDDRVTINCDTGSGITVLLLDEAGNASLADRQIAIDCADPVGVEGTISRQFACSDLNVSENALSLNGIDEYGVIEEIVREIYIITGNLSIGLWVRTSKESGIQRIIGHADSDGEDRIGLILRDGVPEFNYYENRNLVRQTTSISAKESISDGLWHYLTVNANRDDLEVNLYVDGQLMAKRTGALVSINTFFGEEDLYIGRGFNNNPDEYFQGDLDDLLLWNMPRNQAEILQDMQVSPEDNDEGFYGFYDFESISNDADPVFSSPQRRFEPLNTIDIQYEIIMPGYTPPVIPSSRGMGIQQVPVSASSADGDQFTYDLTVILQDTIPPVVDFQFVTAFLEEDGFVTITSEDFVQSQNDSCDSLNFFFQQGVFSCEDLGTNNVKLTAEDTGGNRVEAVFTVTIADTIAAPLSIADKELMLGEFDEMTLPFTEVFTGRADCRITDYRLELVSGSIQIDNATDMVTITCADLGDHELLVRGTDYRGGESQTNFTITIVPELYVAPQILVLDHTGNLTVTSSVFEADSRVGCSTEAVTLNILGDSIFDCSNLNRISGALLISETNEVVSIAESSSLDFQNNFTLEAWFRTTEGSGFRRILRKAAGGAQNYSLFLENGVPTVYYDRAGGGVVRTNGIEPANDGLWHHIAGVRDATEDSLKLYIDGIKVSAISVAGLVPVQGNDGLFIGNSSPGATQQFNGEIDAVRIWNTAHSEREIREGRINTVMGNETGLVAAYDFEEAFRPEPDLDLTSLTDVVDQTGNHTGTLSNAGFSNRNALRSIGIEEVIFTGSTATSGVLSDTTFIVIQDTIPTMLEPGVFMGFRLDVTGNLTIEVDDVVGAITDNCNSGQILLSNNQFDCSNLGENEIIITFLGTNGQVFREQRNIVLFEDDFPNGPVFPDTIRVVLTDGEPGVITLDDVPLSSGACGSFALVETPYDCEDIDTDLSVLIVFDRTVGDDVVVRDIPVEIIEVTTVLEARNVNFEVIDSPEFPITLDQFYDSATNESCSTPLSRGVLSVDLTMLNAGCESINQEPDPAIYFGGITTPDTESNWIEFEETSEHVVNGSFTVEAWARRRLVPVVSGRRFIFSAAGILGISTTYGIAFDEGVPTAEFQRLDSPGALLNPLRVSGDSVVADELWHHYAAVLDTAIGEFKLYMDGNLLSSIITDELPETDSRTFFIGTAIKTQPIGLNSFPGEVDEVKIWGVAKTRDQIIEGMQRRPFPNEDGLQLYFDMDDDLSEGTIFDKSGLTNLSGQIMRPEDVSLTVRRLGFQTGVLVSEERVVTATLDTIFRASDTMLVITQDNQPPEVIVQDSITISLGLEGLVALDASQLIISASDGCGEITHVLDRNTFDCSINDMPQIVTLTSTDANGNVTINTTVVTIESSLTFFNCGDPIFVDLDENGIGTISNLVDSLEQVTFSTIEVSRDTFNCADLGLFNLEATVTDPFSNVINVAVTLSIYDPIIPTANCVEPFTLSLDRNGQATIDINRIDNGSFDNCNFVSSLSQTTFDSTHLGINEVMMFLVDDFNKKDTCSVEITLIGFIPPVASCLPVDTVYLDESGNAGISIEEIYNGDVNNTDISSITLSAEIFDCSSIGEQSITLTLTDSEGIVTTCTSSVIVLDTIAPLANCVAPFTVQLDSTGLVMITVADINNGSSDICGVADLSLNFSEFDLSDIGENELILTITDSSGNTSSCSTIVTVEDNIAPQIEGAIFSIAENSANGTVVGQMAAIDQPGTVFRDWIISSGNSEGIFSLNPLTGALSVADSTLLDAERISNVSLSVIVSDGNNTSEERNFIVSVLDENDNTPVIQSNQEFTISTRASNNSSLGVIVAVDEDVTITDFTSWEIIGSNGGGAFSLHAETGELTLADSSQLNFQLQSEYSINVRVSDGLNISETDSITIRVLNDDFPPLIIANQELEITENSMAGTVLGIPEVTDDNVSELNSWSIVSGNDSGTFDINAVTGVISVADGSLLDVETVSAFTLGISVNDRFNSSEIEELVIRLVDENDVVPIIRPDQEFIVGVSSVNGFSLGIPLAEDGDVTATSFGDWSIASGNSGGTFSIVQETGELILSDASTFTAEENQSFNLLITVSDGVNTSEPESILIRVVTNNNPPVVASDQALNIFENILNETVIGTLEASDPDGDFVTNWEIVSGNETGIFSLDRANGQLLVADSSQIDFESGITSYQLGIVASDRLAISEVVIVTVNLIDVNDVFPVILPDQEFTIRENSPNGFLAGILSAVDGDATPTVFTDWMIVNQDSGSAFKINPESGELIVNNSTLLDFINLPVITFLVSVSDGVNRSEEVNVIINITEEGNLPPAVTPDQVFEIAENIANDELVGNILATDPEMDMLTWTVTSGNETNIFSLNSITGALTINDNSQIDHESIAEYELLIAVSDQEFSSIARRVIIRVTDVNDNAPVIEAGQLFTVFENSPNETLVGLIAVEDGDLTPSQFVNWEILSGNVEGVFSIDPVTGELKVANSANLNFEINDSFSLEIRVSDGLNISESAIILVSVLNVNDPPMISAITDVTISSDQQAGPIMFTVTDQDNESENLGVTFMLDSESPIETSSVTFNGMSADRSITLVPSIESQGTTTVTLVVSDGILSDTTRFRVFVQQAIQNDPPTGITLSPAAFPEESPVNHEVGILETTDPDPVDNHTYEFVSGRGDVDNELFKIEGDRLLTNALFDFEEQEIRTIRVRSTDIEGESVEMFFEIELIPNPELPLVVTTAFTPNGDGVNDIWYIDNISFHPDARIIVINQRGNVVFESTGYEIPWNGQFNGSVLPFDVYYYSISLSNGISLSGPITILR